MNEFFCFIYVVEGRINLQVIQKWSADGFYCHEIYLMKFMKFILDNLVVNRFVNMTLKLELSQ